MLHVGTAVLYLGEMARHYIAIRTDKRKKPFILRELEQGRLRQGWGWLPSQDLRRLRAKLNDDQELDGDELAAWRNRRMLGTEPDGLRVDDIVVLPNLPEQGQWMLARVAGPYTFEISTEASDVGPDYGHILRVDPVRDREGRLVVVEADNANVDAPLRASMRNMSRMWSLDDHARSVDKLTAAIATGADTTTPEPEVQKFETFFKRMRSAAWGAIHEKYKGAEFEPFVGRLLEHIFVGGIVEHHGGPGEKGADFIVSTKGTLGLEYKIAVQVKLHDGIHDDPHALDQIRRAHAHHRVHAGLVITTAETTSKGFDDEQASLEAKLGIDVRVITRDELVELVMLHLGGDRTA